MQSTELYKPRIYEFENKNSFLEIVRGSILDKILDTNAEKGMVRLCLNGNSTLLEVYKTFGQEYGFPWEKLSLYQTDEKIDSNNSFQEQILKTLDQDIKSEIAEINFFNLKFPKEMVIKDYIEYLDNLDGLYFDLVILEILNDGSIAGLFPKSKILSHQDSPVVETIAPSYLNEPYRVTLSIESILNTDEIFVVVDGPKKIEVLSELLEGLKKATEFPAKFLLAHPKVSIFWYLG